MQRSQLILAICRVSQILCASAVLSIAIVQLVEAYDIWVYNEDGPDWAAPIFLVLVGAFGLGDSLAGLVAVFRTGKLWTIVSVLDALSAIFYLAGGIVSWSELILTSEQY